MTTLADSIASGSFDFIDALSFESYLGLQATDGASDEIQ
jgi:hypothetical protein